jgi:hypothetical protein
MANEPDRVGTDGAVHIRALTLFERLADQPGARRELSEAEPPEVLAVLTRLEAADRRARASFPTVDDAESVRRMLPLPERVGSYRLIELIGEGGMGLVFAGVRDDGLFDHRVAIKLIHPDRFGPAAIERFNRERRLLARLDHPFIARLIDGGITDDGWPYIIMELIEGQTIDRHISQHSCDADAVIAMLIGAAEALQAAHEALVIHGDIKPENILIRPDGTPRLLDFGVARLADIEPPRELAARTAAFCAPELRRGESSSLRSDIYSFGALMRRLLFDEGAIQDRSLESIASKAAATDPSERYGNAAALLSDLRRWRTRQPVSARERTLPYVAGLFIRRNWLSSAIVATLLLVLALAFVITLVAWRSERARIEDIRKLTHFQLVELDRRLSSLPHSIALRARLAVEAQAYLGRLALDSGSPGALRREAADGFRRLALLQGAADRPSLGDPIAARASCAKALSTLPRLKTRTDQEMRASILIDAARVASGDAEPRLAGMLLDQARPYVAEGRDRAKYMLTLSEVEQWNGHYARAISTARGASRLLAGLPDDPETMAMRISAVDLAAEARFYAGDNGPASALYRQALDMAIRAARRWPAQLHLRWIVERANWALGTTLLEAGDFATAAPLLERAYTSAHADIVADPADGVAQRRYRSFMLAYAQSLTGIRADEGIALILRSQSLREQWWQQSPGDEGRQRDWILATAALGDALAKSRDARAACIAYGRARSLIETMRDRGRLTKLDESWLTHTFDDGPAARCPRTA